MSTSGSISLDFAGAFSFDCPSISISEDESVLSNNASGFPRAANRVFATGLVEVYVSVITWMRRSGDRCFRIEEMERRTRNVKRASN